MRDPSPYAGQTVRLRADAAELGGYQAEVVDWYERTGDRVSWHDNPGDPRVQNYTIRRGLGQLPDDDEVLFARVDGMGQLIHVTEVDGYAPEQVNPRGPAQVDLRAVGQECPACKVPLAEGDWTAVLPIGPGADPAARTNARAGLPFESVVIEIHWACHTGDESYSTEG